MNEQQSRMVMPQSPSDGAIRRSPSWTRKCLQILLRSSWPGVCSFVLQQRAPLTRDFNHNLGNEIITFDKKWCDSRNESVCLEFWCERIFTKFSGDVVNDKCQATFWWCSGSWRETLCRSEQWEEKLMLLCFIEKQWIQRRDKMLCQ